MAPDVIIVGSGPSGVSAAWPLVQAGHQVMLLDQGRYKRSEWTHDGTLLDMRKSDLEQWKVFFGADYGGIDVSAGKQSPKFRVPAHRYVHSTDRLSFEVESQGIYPTLSLARGGISQMWGAGTFAYEDYDLEGFPLERSELSESYKRVAARIGISGSTCDDLAGDLGMDIPLQPPVELHPAAAKILGRYQKGRKSKKFKLGLTRNAVTTDDTLERFCQLSNKCMWGCPHNAIYSAAQDIERLQQYSNFRYVDGAFVESIGRAEHGFELACDDLEGEKGSRTFRSAYLVLAAGTLSTTKLVLDYLGYIDSEINLGCHPAFALAVTIPELIGADWADNSFALGHLAYKVELGEKRDDYAFGVVFSTEGMLASDLIQHMPLSQPSAREVAGLVFPATLVLNGYLHSRHGSATVKVQRMSEGKTKLILSGEHASTYEHARKQALRVLKPALIKLGALPLPGSSKVAELGTDGHFCGTFPMSRLDQELHTDPEGQLYGHDRLYIADGSVLPHMTAKHPTFTFMANADRIGQGISSKLTRMREGTTEANL